MSYRTGTEHHNWQGTEITYDAAHKRVRGRKGPASSHTCAMCRGRAEQWAYDHGDPGERVELLFGKLLPYSPDPQSYFPLCRRCHKAWDGTKGRTQSAEERLRRSESAKAYWKRRRTENATLE